MNRTLLLAALALSCTTAWAAPASTTYVDQKVEQAYTQLNSYNHGNTLAIGYLSEQKDLTNGRVTSLEQSRNEYGARLDAQAAATADLDSRVSQRWMAQQGEMNSMRRDIDSLKSGQAALGAAASLQFCTQCGFQVAAGVSTMEGRQGAALGLGGAFNDRWFMSGMVMTSGGTTGGALSATYTLGR